MELPRSILMICIGFTGFVVRLVVCSSIITGSVVAGVFFHLGKWITNSHVHPGLVLKAGQADVILQSINRRYENKFVGALRFTGR